MKKLLILDCDGVCWSVFHALKGKLSHDGKDTGIIYGFLSHLFAVQSYEKADTIVFAWDSNTKGSKRKEIFPEYKQKRHATEKTQEEIALDKQRYNQVKILREDILPKLGFSNIFSQDGYEGDDVIASIVNSYKKDYFIKIVARDKDLYQLIDKNVVMYDPVKGEIMTFKLIKETYGIEPYQFRDVKALCGCPTDEVPGVPGIGETKAIQYITGKLKYTTKAYKTIENSSSVIALTRALTSLPFEGTDVFTLAPDRCYVNCLKSVARVYGIKSLVTETRLLEYERNFCIRKFSDIREQTGTGQVKGGVDKFGDGMSDF